MAGDAFRTEPPRGNPLFIALVTLSAVAHLLAIWLTQDLWTEEPVDVIELSLTPSYRAPQRQIPRPRSTPPPPPRRRRQLPKPFPMRDLKAPSPLKLTAAPRSLKAPDVNPVVPPVIPPSSIIPYAAHRVLPPAPRPQDTDAEKIYFAAVRDRINSHKTYPEDARRRKEEGAVAVRFTIRADGRLVSVEAIGGAASTALRKAALASVRSAAPFPPFPAAFNRRDIAVRLTIRFKLDRH